MVDILVLSKSDVERTLTMRDTIVAVEKAFKALAEGQALMPKIVHLDVLKHRGDFDVKGSLLDDINLAGFKITSGYFNNPAELGLPSIMGAIYVADSRSGLPLAVMDASLITAVRTGAAGGVAAKYLARKDSAIVGLIGTGVQGRTQVQAVNELFSLELVKAYDLSKESRERFCAEMSGKLGLRVEPVDTGRECVVGSDIVVTATYSKTPVVLDEWVDEGTHITSIGADVKGKQELDTRLYQRAKVVVDRREVALSKGLLREDQIHAELGEIIAGFRKGRENDGEITIFDASGLGIQDLAAASVVIENAKKMGLGTVVPFM